MKRKKNLATALALLCVLGWVRADGKAAATDDPGGMEEEVFVAVKAGLVYPVTGEPIKGGTIVIRNGVIEAVGKNVEIPRSAEVIHAEDLVVMPGMINPCTSQGLKEINRRGVQANLKVADEFRLDPKLYGKLLQCGFTAFGLLPSGSGFPGQALAFKPVGDCRSKWTVRDDAYLLITMTRPSSEKMAFKKAMETAQKEIEKVEKARKEWEEQQKKKKEEAAKKQEAEKDKKEEKKEEKKDEKSSGPSAEPEKKPAPKEEEKKNGEDVFKPPPINPLYQPLVDLIQKKPDTRTLVVLSSASDFVHFQEVAEDYAFPRTYRLLNGSRFMGRVPSSDFRLALPAMAEEKAAVVFQGFINVKPYTAHGVNLPAAFDAAGCEVTVLPGLDAPEGHAEFLFRVGQLVKNGMNREAALKAVTLHPARVLGLGDRLGSIEKGKDGDLLFLTGDPFHPLTRIEKIMIEGKMVAEGRSVQ